MHIIDLKGSDLEGWWFTCSCGAESPLYADRIVVEMEISVHEVINE